MHCRAPCYLGGVLVLLCAACSDAPTAPIPGNGNGNGMVTPTPTPAPIPPGLAMTAPERGAWIRDGEPTVARGQATPGNSPLTELRVNGERTPLGPDGSIEVPVEPVPGVNVLNVRVDDARKDRTTDAIGFMYGPVHPPASRIEQAAVLQLGPDFLDDDDPDLDDIASIMEATLRDPSFSTALQRDFEADGLRVTPSEVRVGDIDVELVPFDGELDLTLLLDEVFIAFDASGTGILDWVSSPGTMTSTRARIQIAVAAETVSGDDGQRSVAIRVQRTWTVLEGFHFDLDLVPDFAEDFETVQNAVRDTVIESIESEATPLIETVLTELLGAFAVERMFADDTVRIELTLGHLDVVPQGLLLGLDALTEALEPMPVTARAGSLRSEGALPAGSITFEPVGLVIDDDVINQLLFATWQSGLMSDLVFDEAELRDLGADEFPPPLSPLKQVVVNLELPPTLVPTEDPWHYKFGVGEARIDFLRPDGARYLMSVNLRGDVLLTPDGDGGVQLELDARPRALDLGVAVLQAPELLDPTSLAALGRLIVPPVLKEAAGALTALPLPDLDLHALFGFAALEGVVLRMNVGQVKVTGDHRELVKIEGALLPRDAE